MCVHVAVDVCVCVYACSCRCGRVRVLVLVHLQIDPERKVHTVMRVLIQNGKKKNMHTMIRGYQMGLFGRPVVVVVGGFQCPISMIGIHPSGPHRLFCSRKRPNLGLGRVPSIGSISRYDWVW